MPANNSKVNRNIRRFAALERFKLDPAKQDDVKYQERKAEEKAALSKYTNLR